MGAVTELRIAQGVRKTIGRIGEKKMSKHIQVEHPNGYYGELYGQSSLSIFKGTKEVFHTGRRSIETAEELYQVLEEFPQFIELFIRACEQREKENGRKKNDSEDNNSL